MHTYFCPSCGRGYESRDSLHAGRPFTLWPLACPECGQPLELSGFTILFCAFLVWVLLAMVMCAEAGMFGDILGGALAGLGVVRLLRQLRAWIRARALGA